MHHRLQAWLRDNTCQDIEYLGEQEDHNGEMKHLYRIGEHKVFHDQVEELEMVEVDARNKWWWRLLLSRIPKLGHGELWKSSSSHGMVQWTWIHRLWNDGN